MMLGDITCCLFFLYVYFLLRRPKTASLEGSRDKEPRLYYLN
jgi:hypothetical protein